MIAMHYLIDTKEYALYTVLGKTTVNIHNDFVKFSGNVSITLIHSQTKEKFKISPISHYDIVSKMKTAVDWFYDKKMNDLFVVDERGVLIFNNDYNKLSITIHSNFNQHIEIRPVVNNANSERGKEGVIIRVNQSGAIIIMDREEFERMYFYLANFSYQSEMHLLLDILKAAKNKDGTQAIPQISIDTKTQTNPFGL